MAYFIVSVLGRENKVIEQKKLDIAAETAEEAMNDPKVVKLKKEAKNQGFGFSINRQ